KIVDRETREQLPDGEIGVLLVRGECVMLGFHKRELQETFDPDGWYATGDLCSWREGLLYFHGRGGDMIKTGGFNVAPAEVERAIDAIDDVMYVGVVGVADPVREQIVGAMVALKPGSDATGGTGGRRQDQLLQGAEALAVCRRSRVPDVGDRQGRPHEGPRAPRPDGVSDNQPAIGRRAVTCSARRGYATVARAISRRRGKWS